MEKTPRTPRQPAGKQNGPELPNYMKQNSGRTGNAAGYTRSQPTASRGGAASQRSAHAAYSAQGQGARQTASGARSTQQGTYQQGTYPQDTRPQGASQQRSAARSSSAGGAAGGRGHAAASGRPAQRSGRSGGSGGSSSGGAKRKKKVTRAQKLMRISLLIFGALVLVVGGILLLQNAGGQPSMNAEHLEGKKFFEGVTIEGVDVSEKTIEQARPLVRQAVDARLGSVAYTISGEDKNWTVTAADMNLSADVDALMNEALVYGRSGSLGENAEAKQLASQQGRNFEISFSMDRQALLNKLYQIAEEVNTAAVEPQLIPSLNEIDGSFSQSFEPVAGADGRMLDADATADAIGNLLQNGQLQATVEPVYETVPPAMTLAFLQENTQRISTFSTNYATSSSNQTVKNRCFNIEKAKDIINCYTVQPGEEWSFNGWVGPRNKENGWAEANGISGGKEYTLQYGGGICQVSTTLYGALLRGNITITERNKHSIPSDYVDYGLDATVDTNGLDLKFVNDTGAPIYVFAYIKKYEKRSGRLEITVSLYGKPLSEGVTYEPTSEIIEEIPNEEVERIEDGSIPAGYEMERYQHRKGYVVEVHLVKKVNGEEESRVFVHKDKYRGNKQTLLIGTGDPLTTPVPDGAKPVGSIGMTEDTTAGDTAEAVPDMPTEGGAAE